MAVLITNIYRFEGLSGDEKPTVRVPVGSRFYETDTQKFFTLTEALEWVEAASLDLYLPDGSIQAVKLAAGAALDNLADGSILASKLAVIDKAIFGIPLSGLVTNDSRLLGTVADGGQVGRTLLRDNTWGFPYNLLKGYEPANGNTKNYAVQFQFPVPVNFVSGGDFIVRVPVKLEGNGHNDGSMVSVLVSTQVHESPGANLRPASQTFAAVNTWYDKDFVIDSSGLSPGDMLNIFMQADVTESLGVNDLIFRMAAMSVLCDVYV